MMIGQRKWKFTKWDSLKDIGDGMSPVARCEELIECIAEINVRKKIPNRMKGSLDELWSRLESKEDPSVGLGRWLVVELGLIVESNQRKTDNSSPPLGVIECPSLGLEMKWCSSIDFLPCEENSNEQTNKAREGEKEKERRTRNVFEQSPIVESNENER